MPLRFLKERMDFPFGNTKHESVEAEEAQFGRQHSRPFQSEGDTSVAVPGDYATIQEAVWNLPYWNSHRYTITIEPGHYPEDVYIPPAMSTRRDPTTDSTDLERPSISIVGNGATSADVTVQSIFIDGLQGMGLQARDFETTGQNPWTDEGSAIEVYGSGSRTLFQNINITNADLASGETLKHGFTSYSSNISASDIDFGTDMVDCAIQAKHSGRGHLEDSTGTVDRAARANIGWITLRRNSLETRLPITVHAGMVADTDTGAVWGPNHIYPAPSDYTPQDIDPDSTETSTDWGSWYQNGTDKTLKLSAQFRATSSGAARFIVDINEIASSNPWLDEARHVDADDRISFRFEVLPDHYFRVRNVNGTSTTSLTLRGQQRTVSNPPISES